MYGFATRTRTPTVSFSCPAQQYACPDMTRNSDQFHSTRPSCCRKQTREAVGFPHAWNGRRSKHNTGLKRAWVEKIQKSSLDSESRRCALVGSSHTHMCVCLRFCLQPHWSRVATFATRLVEGCEERDGWHSAVDSRSEGLCPDAQGKTTQPTQQPATMTTTGLSTTGNNDRRDRQQQKFSYTANYVKINVLEPAAY